MAQQAGGEEGEVLWAQRKKNWCRTPFSFTLYSMTDTELTVRSGIITQDYNTVRTYRILDVSASRTLLQRIFGLWTVTVIAAAASSSDGTIVLKNITDGLAVRKMIAHAMEQSRALHGVRSREYMSDGGYGDNDYDGDGIGY